jgi:NO-binding membrane sensor protein with MHYT domain
VISRTDHVPRRFSGGSSASTAAIVVAAPCWRTATTSSVAFLGAGMTLVWTLAIGRDLPIGHACPRRGRFSDFPSEPTCSTPYIVKLAVAHIDFGVREMARRHNPYLVALSVAVVILGGYTGFGLAARVRGASGASRRLLLAGAAGFLAVGIWTMHFIGVMAAPIPADAAYLLLPTIVSFLICALVVGLSLFFLSVGEPTDARVTASALLLGGGIVSMHYVGIHGLAGAFTIEHEHAMVVVAALIAVGTAYGGLRIFLARRRLALSAVAFGFAASGMQ